MRSQSEACAIFPVAAPEAADLFEMSGVSQQWYVLHAKPRREKKVAGCCAELGIRHYLPLRRSITRSGGRVFRFDVPLFPGYVFCCCDWGGRHQILRTNHVANLLEVGDEPQLLHELQNIYLALAANAGLVPCAHLERGARVRVVRGPLTGAEGTIVRRRSEFSLVMSVSMLGSSVAVEIDEGDVEAL